MNRIFTISVLPEVEFYVVSGNLPGITLNPAIGTRQKAVEVPYAGDAPVYNPLTISFLVDENLKNWIACYRWLECLGGDPRKFDYNLQSSDASLIFNNTQDERVLSVKFLDCVPTSLSDITFSESETDREEKVATIMLEYDHSELDIPGENE